MKSSGTRSCSLSNILIQPFDQGDVYLIQPVPMLKSPEQEGKTSCSDQGVSVDSRNLSRKSPLLKKTHLITIVVCCRYFSVNFTKTGVTQANRKYD